LIISGIIQASNSLFKLSDPLLYGIEYFLYKIHGRISSIATLKPSSLAALKLDIAISSSFSRKSSSRISKIILSLLIFLVFLHKSFTNDSSDKFEGNIFIETSELFISVLFNT
jgi:hypothetical protein